MSFIFYEPPEPQQKRRVSPLASGNTETGTITTTLAGISQSAAATTQHVANITTTLTGISQSAAVTDSGRGYARRMFSGFYDLGYEAPEPFQKRRFSKVAAASTETGTITTTLAGISQAGTVYKPLATLYVT